MTRIAVPADKVRTREQILDGLIIWGGSVWLTCHNCGGSGTYPSSMSPPGMCRFYCWKGKEQKPELYGKVPVDLEKFVKRSQASDRAAYRAQVKWEQDAPARAEAAREWARREEIKQQEIARQAADVAARKAISQYVGEPGQRLDLDLTVARVASYQTRPFRSWGNTMVTKYVLTMRDVAGNVFVWFADYKRDQGEQLKVRATVKEHKAYQDERQTVIFRVKEVE